MAYPEKPEDKFHFSDGGFTRTPIYYSVCRAARVLFDACGRLEVAGLENIDFDRPFILASNHASFLDPLLIGAVLPKEVYFLARQTLFKPGFFSWFYNAVHCIAVDRDGGGADVGAFKKMFATVRRGEPVALFPEGTRTTDGALKPAKAGVAMLACKFGVPVVPARIFGTFEMLGPKSKFDPRHDLSIHFGRPVDVRRLDPGPKDPERYQKVADKIMEAIAALAYPEPPML